MIIGFLGKGGSGKSTLSTAMAIFLHSKKQKTVLAIDADYNMDLSYNLGAPESIPYISESLPLLKKTIHVADTLKISDIVLTAQDAQRFTLNPKDLYTEAYTTKLSNGIHLMSVGPHSDKVIYGKACSHSLTVSLKAYLPLLSLKKEEVVVVDEKAGSDSVGTGIPTGFTMSVIVSEATPHGLKTARQIHTMLQRYSLPSVYVINKVKEKTKEIEDLVVSVLEEKPLCYVPYGESIDTESLETIYTHVDTYMQTYGDMRYAQSVLKFKNNSEYTE